MRTLQHLLLSMFFLAVSTSVFGVAKPSQQEKVYLHFDNTAYYLGETIWFKAYVVQTGRNALSPLSKTLYVDLLTPEGNVVESKKVKITDGKGVGDFLLKDSLRAGFYEVRAYTRFVLNQGDEAIFSRVFACYDKPGETGNYQERDIANRRSFEALYQFRPKTEKSDKLNFFFYPEGGNLIEGVNSRVAFQAFDKDGLDVALTGAVISEKGDTLATLATQHQGMGAFFYSPGKEKAKAVVTYDDKVYRFDMPSAQKQGYTLNVDAADPERLILYIQSSPNMPLEPLGIDISCRGQRYAEDTLSLYQGNAMALNFPTKMLPSGVIQITLHSLDGRPLAQRLAFVNHNSQMRIDATANKKVYKPYERINLELSLTDSKGQPVQTELSLSVRDAATTPVDPFADNILTNLLLSSELKGYIQSPGYYFQDNDPQRKADLDLLMMIQGWTRYEWKRIAGLDTTQYKHLYEQSLLVEGNAYTVFRKKAKEGLEVTMVLSNDSTSQHGTCSTDKEGRFNMLLADFNGKADLMIETKKENDRKEHVIRLDRVFSPSLRAYKAGELLLPDWSLVDNALIEDIAEGETTEATGILGDTLRLTKKVADIKSRLLPQVEVNAKRKTTAEDDGRREANVVINVEESLDRLLDMGEWVPASALSTLVDMIPYFSCTRESGPRYKGRKTALLVDNRPLQEVATAMGITEETAYDQLLQFASIDLSLVTVKEGYDPILSQFNIDPSEFDASIYMYTDPKRKVPIGIRNTKFQGYALSKSFYSPPYDMLVMPDVNDVRRTLYWDPFVKTDATGKAKVTFFNNRSGRTININAETVTENGIIGTLSK